MMINKAQIQQIVVVGDAYVSPHTLEKAAADLDLIGAILYFSLALYVWGWMAELYTAVAVSVLSMLPLEMLIIGIIQ